MNLKEYKTFLILQEQAEDTARRYAKVYQGLDLSLQLGNLQFDRIEFDEEGAVIYWGVYHSGYEDQGLISVPADILFGLETVWSAYATKHIAHERELAEEEKEEFERYRIKVAKELLEKKGFRVEEG